MFKHIYQRESILQQESIFGLQLSIINKSKITKRLPAVQSKNSHKPTNREGNKNLPKLGRETKTKTEHFPSHVRFFL